MNKKLSWPLLLLVLSTAAMRVLHDLDVLDLLKRLHGL